MENRYLFRAKRIDNREWIIGNLICSPDGRNAISETGGDWMLHEVDPSTVCQCTGLKGKNGKMIWENDIISINTYSYEEPEDTVVGVVKYSEANTGFCLDDGDAWIPINEIYGSYTTEYFVEGNIFDNPELMEQEG